MRLFIVCALACCISGTSFAYEAFDLQWKNDANRDMYSSGDHGDAVFVIEFFQNFCGACNDNAANVNELKDLYMENERVQVLSVGLDSSDREYRQWIARHNPNHPVLNGYRSQLARDADFRYIPTAIILDCNYEEQWRHVGVWGTQQKQELRDTIDEILANTTCE